MRTDHEGLWCNWAEWERRLPWIRGNRPDLLVPNDDVVPHWARKKPPAAPKGNGKVKVTVQETQGKL